jgi:hypothetical protein
MKNKNSFNLSILNDEQCRIEAKCLTLGNSQLNNSKMTIEENTATKNQNYIITSGSLNLSKTINDLSFQTVRVSKNSLTNSNIVNYGANVPSDHKRNNIFGNNYMSNRGQIDLDKLISLEVSDDNGNNDNKELNPDFSTNSIVFNKERKSPQSNKHIFCTPSTICNYYERSNEITPNKLDFAGNSNSNRAKLFKLDLNDINVNVFDEINYENNSSARLNNLQINNNNNQEEFCNYINKKTPIKYTRSQLTSGDKSGRGSAQSTTNNNNNININNISPNSKDKDIISPLESILTSINYKNGDVTNNNTKNNLPDSASKRETIVNISQLEIEDKLLDDEPEEPEPKHIQSSNILNLQRINLNLTFNKIKSKLESKSDKKVNENIENSNKEQIQEPIKTIKNPIISILKNNNTIETTEKKESIYTRVAECLSNNSLHHNLKNLLSKNKNKLENINFKDSPRLRLDTQGSRKNDQSEYYTLHNYTTPEGRITDHSPHPSSHKKTSNYSTNYSNHSKSSYSNKYIYTQESIKSKGKTKPTSRLSSNSQIKQFLLTMLNDNKKKEDGGKPTFNISNNININKLVIQSSSSKKLSDKQPAKKSNTVVANESAKKRCRDVIKLYSSKNTNNNVGSYVKRINSQPNNSLSKGKNSSTSKTKENKNSSISPKVYEYTINLDQVTHTKSNIFSIKKEHSDKLSNSPSLISNRPYDKHNISHHKTFDLEEKSSLLVKPNNYNTVKTKIISNFSNYTKKINSVPAEVTMKSENSERINSIDIANKKQVVSSKITYLNGDDDSVLIEDTI